MSFANSTLIQRYFTGLTEFVFHSRLGVADPGLVEYVSGVLVRFVRLDVHHKIRTLSGKKVTEVADMLAEANERVGGARREVHRHIGDFTLFWAGVYPEALREMKKPPKKDHFIDYCAQGKRAYYIASTIEASDDAPPGQVLKKLSHDFEMCAYGLREVRREWEQDLDGDDPPRLLLT